MQLSIIVLNYKSFTLSEKCLRSILKFPPSSSFEVIFMDNSVCKEKFMQLKNKFAHQKNFSFIFSDKNLGFASGVNLASQKAKGKYLAILNPDIRLIEKVFDPLINFLNKTAKAAIVAPKLIFSDQSIQDSFRSFPSFFDLIIKRISPLRKIFHKRLARFLMWDFNFSKTSSVNWVVGAFFMIRKKVFQQLNGFDERFFLFFEDTDLCRRVKEKNLEVIFFPQVKAMHNHIRLSQTKNFLEFFSKKTFLLHIVSAFKYFWKWRK